MPRFNEKSVIEDYLVQELVKKGWKFIKADELERESYEESLLINNLIRKIKELNADLEITEEEIKKVINILKLTQRGQEGAKQILNYLKFGVAVKFEKQREVHYIKLFDYDDIKNNEFIISRQVIFQSADNEIRTDITLFINGIPLVDIECKNPADFSVSWYDAYKQIKDYENIIPEAYKYIQIGIAAEQIVKYFPIVPWQEDIKSNEWKEYQKDPIDSIIEMLSPDILLDIIKNFLFMRIEMGNQTKVITRYMQYRAVNKVINRIINYLQGKEEKNKGLVWHWQGSGKTLEMIFAASKLYNLPLLENPSIFFIVDRVELEEQLFTEFNALDITRPDLIASIADLKRILKHDEYKGKRGILITLVHKFRVEELHELKKEIEEASEGKETILTRKNVIAFVDEGHRTQYGTLAAQMRDILREAFFFAFTGTPISKRGRDTYLTFSYPPEEKYLDKYFITDSIKDGFTVRIAYQPRLEKEVHLKKEMLDAFLEMEEEEIPEEIRDTVKEKVKKKLKIVHFLEAPSRIKQVAEDIVEHFKENVDGKFKALVVAVNRNACVTYKKELDRLLPKEYSEIVMTFDEKKDSQQIKDYLHNLMEKHKGKEIDDIRKDVVDKFKEEEFPKILIVTDMLLTGFDAPILQSLYLDKPLKEHRLLQAIARTNRPYRGVKEAGLIIDYIGILEEFKKSLEMYSKEEINGALYNIEDLRLEFKALIEELLEIFEGVPKNQNDRKTLLKAIEILTSEEEKGKEFLEKYKTLRRVFELLGPDIIKAKLFSEYQWLTTIYTYYLRMVLRNQSSDKSYVEHYFNKTIKYIYKTTEFENFEKNLPVIKFDEEYLRKLEEKFQSKEEKAANIVFTLNRYILVERQKNPVYESLADKVERLLKLWKEKTKDFEKIYKEGLNIIKQMEILEKRQKELGFDKMEYSLLLLLEKRFGKDDILIEDVKELSTIIEETIFPGWISQPTARKNIERILRKFIRRYIQRYNLKLEDLEEIYGGLVDYVREYA